MKCTFPTFLSLSLSLSLSSIVLLLFRFSGLAELQNLGITDGGRVFFTTRTKRSRLLHGPKSKMNFFVRARETGFSGRALCLARSNLSKNFNSLLTFIVHRCARAPMIFIQEAHQKVFLLALL